MVNRFCAALGSAALLLLGFGGQRAEAAEGAIGAYLLGTRGPMAGFTPPEGIYFQDYTYLYSGSIGGGRSIASGGLLAANISAKTWLNLPTFLWVTPLKVLGGDFAVSVTAPFGGPRVDATLEVNSPRLGPLGARVSDYEPNLSDIFVNTFVGWHAGNFHWQVGAAGVIPSGTYTDGSLSNASLNRPAVDTFGALTWLDPTIGVDLSASAGFTFNLPNTATNYRTGDEFHVEWAASKFLTREFTVGFVGYYYQQITGDSGSGARLGAFEGRVVAAGGTAGYTFTAGQIPIATRVTIFQEVDAQNRMQGTVGYFSVSLPLAVGASTTAAAAPIQTRF